MRKFLLYFLMCLFSVSIYAQISGSMAADQKIRNCLDVNKIVYTILENGLFSMNFDAGNGRHQFVYINSQINNYEHLNTIDVYSWIGSVTGKKLNEDSANWLLFDDGLNKMGTYACSYVDDTNLTYVYFKVSVDRNIDPQSLYTVIRYVLYAGDRAELVLFSKDEW